MRLIRFLIFLGLWLFHVLTMAGAAGAVILRLWEERDDWLARAILWLMGAPIVLCLAAVVLPIIASIPPRSVKFNMKFSIALWAALFLVDVFVAMFAIKIVKKRVMEKGPGFMKRLAGMVKARRRKE